MGISKEDVAAAVRHWLDLNNRRQAAEIAAMEGNAVGFGYRSPTLRDLSQVGEAGYAAGMARFFATLEFYEARFEELETAVHGEIGFAWGRIVEDLRYIGRDPERARVRFSQAMAKTDRGWQVLSFHRDIQPFDSEGRYPGELTSL